MNLRFVVTNTVVIFISIFGLSQCETAKMKLQKTAPFTITQSFYQEWVGGQPGNSGTTLQLLVTVNDAIIPDSLYFQNRVTSVDTKPSKTGKLWVGNFQKVVRKDFNMTDTPQGEYGNKVPTMIDFPFDLKKDEAVLKYTKEGKSFYYKIVGIVQEESLYYPSARPRR